MPQWPLEFLSRTLKGEWATYIKKVVGEPPIYTQILLLPKTLDTEGYKKPTFTEVAALCYGVQNQNAPLGKRKK